MPCAALTDSHDVIRLLDHNHDELHAVGGIVRIACRSVARYSLNHALFLSWVLLNLFPLSLYLSLSLTLLSYSSELEILEREAAAF
jgi:hypothetical protein